MDISSLRESYSNGSLGRKDVDQHPLQQFQKWFKEALDSKCPEPNAMTIATVNAEGIPSARTILLKGLTESGFIFYTNYESAKAQDIESNQHVALVFNWLELQRQIRINGLATKTDFITSETYFHSRPRGSQIGTYVSEQSKVIENRDYLEQRLKQFETKFKDSDTIPLPQNWGGYHVEASSIEFWQGRRSRLHDRLRYTKLDNNWQIERLAP